MALRARTAWDALASETLFLETAERPLSFFSRQPSASGWQVGATVASPTFVDEVSFINGLRADGSVNSASYFQTPIKWGAHTAGTGATITFSFSTASHFSDTEKSVFYLAFATWETAANIHFSEVSSGGNIALVRGSDGGANCSFRHTFGSGTTTGYFTSQAVISIDTSVYGFDLSGSFAQGGGYGISTAIHEVGHALGLGHGGQYNNGVNYATQQFSAYDSRLWTTMSYIDPQALTARYASEYPVKDTFWGRTSAPHSLMAADIAAIRQLYGPSFYDNILNGAIIGFNSTLEGPLATVYDFTLNSSPVLTLILGVDTTLDLSGYGMNQRIDLTQGEFSDVGGLRNNIGFTYAFQSINLICGAGNDSVVVGPFFHAFSVRGGEGNDVLTGAIYNNERFFDGVDRLLGEGGKDKIEGNDSDDYLDGGDGNDQINGGNGDDLSYGGAGADLVKGGAGDDVISGGSGDDVVSGGSGADRIKGGGGSDDFIFTPTDFLADGSDAPDVILDFGKGRHDLIDLEAFAKNAYTLSEVPLTFIGTADFDGHEGQLRFEIIGNRTFVEGDVDGDGAADFQIVLKSATPLTVDDFYLSAG